MEKHLLTRTQMNDVFTLLRDAGLAALLPAFKWREELWEYNKRTIHSALYFTDGPREYFFRFIGLGKYAPDYYPTPQFGRHQDRRLESLRDPAGDDWAKVKLRIKDWASALSSELLAPDYWATPEDMAARIFATIAAETPHERFSQQEVEHIRESAATYRQELSAQHHLRPEQLREIDRKLDYLVSEAENQSPQAWIHTAIGVVVAIAATIRPEAGVLAGAIALFTSIFALASPKKLP